MNDTQHFSTGAILGGSAFAVIMFLGWATGFITVSEMDELRSMHLSGPDGFAWGEVAIPAAFVAWVFCSGFVYHKMVSMRGTRNVTT